VEDEERGFTTVEARDDGPRLDTSMEALAKLRQAFPADAPEDVGELVVTAGNAPGLSDGVAAEIVASLRKDGIESRDLQTSDFSIEPRYSQPQPGREAEFVPRIIGYAVRNTLTVRIRDLDQTGALLDKEPDADFANKEYAKAATEYYVDENIKSDEARARWCKAP